METEACLKMFGGLGSPMFIKIFKNDEYYVVASGSNTYLQKIHEDDSKAIKIQETGSCKNFMFFFSFTYR